MNCGCSSRKGGRSYKSVNKKPAIRMKKLLVKSVFLLFALAASVQTYAQQERAVWSKEKANEWYKKVPWMAGANFYPANAINQLEMWQKETFDPATIDRDLGYSAGIGMTVMRVYLHHLAWETDKQGFIDRMKQYLAIADKHRIKTIFVI